MRRLLQITDSFEYTGGIRSYISHVSELLAHRGWEVEIFSPPGPGGDLRSHFTRWAGWRYLAEVRQEPRLESVPVDIDDHGSEFVQRDHHRIMVQRTSGDLARATGDDVDRALVLPLAWRRLRVGAVARRPAVAAFVVARRPENRVRPGRGDGRGDLRR